MANFLNYGTLGGGFRHFSGLLPANLGSGAVNHASVRTFHVAATNATAIFRGDIVVFATATVGVQGGADLPFNITAPSSSVIIGNGGGTGLGNQSMAPNVAKYSAGDAASNIAGVVVGFGPLTLYQAKNGFQYIPANFEAWVAVETDPGVEMYATVPTVPGTAFNLLLNDGIDIKQNAGNQSARYGISGMSLDPATAAATPVTLPLRILSTGRVIGNDPTQAGFVAKVMFNLTRHYRGTAAFVAD